MGWSLDTIKPMIDKVFKDMNMQYDMIHPSSVEPRVYIKHSGVLPAEAKGLITALFPDFVAVEFYNMRFTKMPEVVTKEVTEKSK